MSCPGCEILIKLVFLDLNLLPISQSYRWILTKKSAGIGAVIGKYSWCGFSIGVQARSGEGYATLAHGNERWC